MAATSIASGSFVTKSLLPGNRGGPKGRRDSPAPPQVYEMKRVFGIYSQNPMNRINQQCRRHCCIFAKKKGREFILFLFLAKMVEVPGFVRQWKANLF